MQLLQCEELEVTCPLVDDESPKVWDAADSQGWVFAPTAFSLAASPFCPVAPPQSGGSWIERTDIVGVREHMTLL